MLNFLIRYEIITNRGSGVITGNYINVYWDDSTEAIEVQKFDNSADITGTVMPSGPDIGAERIDSVTRSPRPIPFSFCDGTTFHDFVAKSIFPYVAHGVTSDHFSCSSAVCDIKIADEYTAQEASDSTSTDGALSVLATSSNGVIKFSLDPNFNYTTEGQISGDFPGLIAGIYTVTAKDALGCFDQITIEVKAPSFYNPLYRLEYTDRNGFETRIDILERGYEGSFTEICGGSDDPFILKYNGDGELNKFKSIIPSEAQFTIISETNFQFRHLFSQDDRKYKLQYSKNYGNTIPGFTPAVLDALNLWENIDGIFGYGWTEGANPFVSLAGNGGILGSERIATLYDFGPGREYTFSYQFRRSANVEDFNRVTPTFLIHVTDSSFDTLVNSSFSFVQKLVTIPYGETIVSGEYTFIAPNNAAGLAVTVGSDRNVVSETYYIDSFENETETIPEEVNAFELKWVGFLISDNYSESYLAPPYPVTLTATDGLADLKKYEFLDQHENLYREDVVTLKAIYDILRKTDLNINIQSAINRYEENMDNGSTDDPLPQCKFNPETFYHDDTVKDCFETLDEILKPFAARLLQRNGKWFIVSIEEMVTGMEYREFDFKGNYILSGSYDDSVNINVPAEELVAAFEGKLQVLETVPAFGKMFFEHTLLKHDSLVASYGFEQDDVYEDIEGKAQFENWNVNISGNPGATYGIKETKSLEGDFNFYLKYQLSGLGENTRAEAVSLLSLPFLIEYNANDVFEYGFDYNTLITKSGFGKLPWIKLKWMFNLGSYYYNKNTGWTTDANQKYNEIIITDFNKNQSERVTDLFREVESLTLETAQVEFIFTNVFNYDFFDITSLKATTTTTKPIDSKIKVRVNAGVVSYYNLEESTDAESLPDVVRPNDYASTTNEVVWRLEVSGQAVRRREIEYHYLDNVVLLHYPNGAQPPDNITIEKGNNSAIKLNFEEQYLLNDIDLENINNSERTYKNYFKLLDGSPTQIWERTYRAGTGKLLDLLSSDFASQYSRWSNKLTGSFIADTEVLPTSCMQEVNDGGKKYIFMGYELHDKIYSIGFDILQIGDVTDGDGNAIDAGFTTGFSLGFRS